MSTDKDLNQLVNSRVKQYNGVTWGDILYLGLYLGKTPDYIYKNKSVDSLMGKKPELRFKFIVENSKKIAAESIL